MCVCVLCEEVCVSLSVCVCLCVCSKADPADPHHCCVYKLNMRMLGSLQPVLVFDIKASQIQILCTYKHTHIHKYMHLCTHIQGTHIHMILCKS